MDNQGIVRVVRDPHNLSHSRVKQFFSCPARLGYEGLYEDFRRREADPFWLTGGVAVHFIISSILAKTVAVGKRFEESDIKPWLRRARSHLLRALDGVMSPRGMNDASWQRNPKKVYWLAYDELESLSEEEQHQRIQEKKFRYVNIALLGIKAVMLRATLPSRYKEVMVEKDYKLALQSPRDSRIQIPVWGGIDLIEILERNSLMVVSDWKTGNLGTFLQKDLVGNEQLLLYWWAIRQLYGRDPDAAHVISINISRKDIDKYGAAVLEQEKYRLQAPINFDEQFPELVKEFDDVWAVLNFLAHPPDTKEQREEMEAWEPSSAMGIRMGCKRNVQQGRLLPFIGRQCGMCASRPVCQADNPADWKQHQALQSLGNAVEPQTIPEEWMDPFEGKIRLPVIQPKPQEIVVASGDQRRLFGRGKVIQRHVMKAKDWKKLGFFSPKELVAYVRRMHAIIPLHKGEMCPCKKTDRLPPHFLPHAWEFFREREAYKQAQEAEGKTRSGEGPNKVRDLFDSETVNKILDQCPIVGCPFARKCDDVKTPQAS